jgi:ABC-2 type transport system ATP-binding protein
MDEQAVKLQNIKKSFRLGSNLKRKVAVEDISLDVSAGDIFGLLGPNGAGKTTTLKVMLGLVFPDSGSGTLLGRPLGDRGAHERLGFLPEQSYFYGFLTAEKGLALYGKFFALDPALLKERSSHLLEEVGLPVGSHLTLDKYSKGMLQRFGIAQALLNDPALVILDEPSSGLDPVGQKEVRDILLGLKEQGKTIFLSSHQLSEVETICDSVSIVSAGRSVREGRLSDMLKVEGLTRITLRGQVSGGRDRLSFARDVTEEDGLTVIDVESADTYRALDSARDLSLELVRVEPFHRSLEDLFLEAIKETSP